MVHVATDSANKMIDLIQNWLTILTDVKDLYYASQKTKTLHEEIQTKRRRETIVVDRDELHPTASLKIYRVNTKK